MFTHLDLIVVWQQAKRGVESAHRAQKDGVSAHPITKGGEKKTRRTIQSGFRRKEENVAVTRIKFQIRDVLEIPGRGKDASGNALLCLFCQLQRVKGCSFVPIRSNQ